MNYEEARQIGPDGPNPGKWNWTNYNDSIAEHPYTVPPCISANGIRCDHETREEAERHHWRYEVANVHLHQLDLDRIRERQRCDWPGCPNWEDYQAHWPDGYRVDSLCTAHATLETVVELHPFEPGISSIHS